MQTQYYREMYQKGIDDWHVIEVEKKAGYEFHIGNDVTTVTVITEAHGRHNEEINRRNAMLAAAAPAMLRALLHYRQTGSDELFVAAIAAAVEGDIYAFAKDGD